MPKFLCRTYGQSAGFGDPFTSDVDAATVELTVGLIDLCRKREQQALALYAQDDTLWELYFWHSWPDWYEFYPSEAEENSLIPAGSDYSVDEGELIPVNEAEWNYEDKAVRVECVQMVVSVERGGNGRPNHCEFGWVCYRKHCDVLIRTPRWTIEDLEAFLNPEQEEPCSAKATT